MLRHDAAIDADRLIAQVGEPSWLPEAARDLTFPRGVGLGEGLAPAETLVVNDLAERGEPLMPLLTACGITAFAAAPLVVRGRRLGALVAFMTGAHRFHPPQVQLLESVAQQLASPSRRPNSTRRSARKPRWRRRWRASGASSSRSSIVRRCSNGSAGSPSKSSAATLAAPICSTVISPSTSPMASVGDSSAEWEVARVLRLTPAQVHMLVGEWHDADLVQLDHAALTAHQLALPCRGAMLRALVMAFAPRPRSDGRAGGRLSRAAGAVYAAAAAHRVAASRSSRRWRSTTRAWSRSSTAPAASRRTSSPTCRTSCARRSTSSSATATC